MTEKKIIWLASYPKSGNTWFRAFLTALFSKDYTVDINALETDGIFSNRTRFEEYAGIDSTYLYDEEVKNLLPEVYKWYAADSKNDPIIKVHDAFTMNPKGKPIISEESTKCALYFVRNPLDIVASLANHNGSDIDTAIRFMNNEKSCLAAQFHNTNKNIQFQQTLLSWNMHVESWTSLPKFPVMIVRYEDMYMNPMETFLKASRFMGIDMDCYDLEKAIAATKFDILKSSEKTKGFRENPKTSNAFFRSGTIKSWKNELSEQQIQTLLSVNCEMIERLGYELA